MVVVTVVEEFVLFVVPVPPVAAPAGFGFCASLTKFLIKSIFSAISAASTPFSSSWVRKLIQDGSTLSDVKPFSGS